MKWRRAIAAVCALDLLYSAATYLIDAEQGLLTASLIAFPLALVGGLAGWWAWRGWNVHPVPRLVVLLLWGIAAVALTFGVFFVAERF